MRIGTKRDAMATDRKQCGSIPDERGCGVMAQATGREKTPPAMREEVLERDEYTCQLCRAAGPEAGGVASLHVHHKDPEPATMDRHDLVNLITLCRDCHSWTHKKPSNGELPFTITAADEEVLLPHDYKILQVLYESGPLSTGEIQDALSLELSSLSIRERLWLLMGLDDEVPSREQPLVDQSATTGEWGLPSQIAESERGRIPDDMQSLIRRVNDERVRRALERGCDRSTVVEIFDIAERTSWHKQRRAQAYDFPLGALERGGGAGAESDHGPDEPGDAGAGGQQQRLALTAGRDGTDGEAATAVAAGESDGARSGEAADTESGVDAGSSRKSGSDGSAGQAEVERAIAALRELKGRFDAA